MRKVQFFVIVETILLVMGLMTIMANNLSSFILILVLILLALRFYNQDKRNNLLLTVGLVLLFLILMLNPYIIMAVVLGVVYVVINRFSQVKKNRFALVRFREEDLKAKPIRNQWIGADMHDSDFYAFDDINMVRLTGSDTIDLSNVIVTGKDNVVIIRKVFGPTKILVPIDVSVKLNVSAIYGSVRYFDFEEYDLRNESLKLWHPKDEECLKAVKVIVNVLAGDVEVVRK